MSFFQNHQNCITLEKTQLFLNTILRNLNGKNRHKRIDAELSFPLYLWAFERDEVQWRYKKAV